MHDFKIGSDGNRLRGQRQDMDFVIFKWDNFNSHPHSLNRSYQIAIASGVPACDSHTALFNRTDLIYFAS